MLHLRQLGLIDLGVRTVSGETLGEVLAWWEQSERRHALRRHLRDGEGVDPDAVIFSPETARAYGLTPTLTFPSGNLAPDGAVIKSTAIDPGVLDDHQVYRLRGPARVFTREPDAVKAVKEGRVHEGDVIVLMGSGPLGTGMEEYYQITSALRHLPFGKHVALLTDARFSGVSTGACVGHISPEALAGGPIGKLRDGDLIDVVIDSRRLTGEINFVGTLTIPLSPEEGRAVLESRTSHERLAPDPNLPEDTRLWAALQTVSGGPWHGAVYDVDRIVDKLAASSDAAGAH
jgi:dihydroxyacid dehydratase/phosphogluconate dehydratase